MVLGHLVVNETEGANPMINPYDPAPLYSYPGWPAWVPSTSLMTLPMGGLGAGGGDLGAARLMGPTEVLSPGKLYTYRTFSLVPLVEDASWHRPSANWWQSITGALSSNTAWGNHRGTADILKPPGTARSLYQAASASPYTGSVARYRGRNVYTTSLTFTPKAGGVTAAQAKVAALNILNQMRESFADDQSMQIFEGNLYERGVTDVSAPAPSIVDRVREVITGQDPAAAERERAQQAQSDSTMRVVGIVAAIAATAFGVFIATRKGSAKLEGRAYRAATGPVREARGMARGAAGAALMANRRRKRKRAR